MIHFVGAGPGAVDLITVRGWRLVREADVIIYTGSLVNPDILKDARPQARILNSAYMTLDEVMDVMIDADRQGLNVVRLHTGEPSIYGAVREQMDLLDEKGIAYASCPGVSACFGAAADLNLEFTLPGVSQTLIITRIAGKTAVPRREQLKMLAAHKASMAIYLSAGMLGQVASELIAGGISPDTPAALVYKATWPEEKKILCTVETLERAGQEHGISATAVVLVGDAVSHTDYEKSRLYDPAFSTGFRKASEGGSIPEGPAR